MLLFSFKEINKGDNIYFLSQQRKTKKSLSGIRKGEGLIIFQLFVF